MFDPPQHDDDFMHTAMSSCRKGFCFWAVRGITLGVLAATSLDRTRDGGRKARLRCEAAINHAHHC